MKHLYTFCALVKGTDIAENIFVDYPFEEKLTFTAIEGVKQTIHNAMMESPKIKTVASVTLINYLEVEE